MREAQLEKVPYMLVVGDKEAQTGTVALRLRDGQDKGPVSLTQFRALARQAIKEKL
ncbi:MAG TPA: His/Gly/Thr/Pro-type tRNA ligase C-terminal domain-containing protein [Dehalococcoidia bacterium]|nr:His/Gly/Thr/Pro-type tRNA ligase C-terminal domain-containing protein [Dehalococcoidia bacterium]